MVESTPVNKSMPKWALEHFCVKCYLKVQVRVLQEKRWISFISLNGQEIHHPTMDDEIWDFWEKTVENINTKSKKRDDYILNASIC